MPSRVLIVDDEQDIASVIRIGLKKNGFTADAFSEPEEALSNVKPGLYDLVLLDLKMPKIDGASLYRKIKEIDGKAKVCFITAIDLPDEETKKIVSELGVDCYIKKPFSIDALVAKVRWILDSGI